MHHCSTLISMVRLMNAETLLGSVMPARASAFSCQIYLILMNADALAGIAKPGRASTSISVLIVMNVEAMSAFVPKGPQVVLEACS